MNHNLSLFTSLLLLPLAPLSANPATTNRAFNISEYGAIGNGKKLDTEAIQKAVETASSSGGGTVVFPPGKYLSSSIQMQNNVTLHIEENATLLGSPLCTGYLKGHRHGLLVTNGQTNISNIKITGSNNPLFIRLGNRNSPGAPGTVRGITISDVTAEIPIRPAGKSSDLYFYNHYRHGPLTGLIVGRPGHPSRDVKLRKISITYGGIGDSPEPKNDAPKVMQKQVLLEDLAQVPQQTKAYREAFRFGIVPAWELYIHHPQSSLPQLQSS